MRILLAGSGGWIGQHLNARLAKAGHDVRPYDLADGYDLCDEDVLARRLGRVDLCINLAGEIREGPSDNAPLRYWRNNTYAAVCLFSAARRAGVRVVHASTGACQFPGSHYALSKLAAEYAALHENGLGANITLLRIFNVYGPSQPLDFVVPKFIHQALTGEEIRVSRDHRDFIHIDDVVAAFVRVAVFPEACGMARLFEVGSGYATSIKDLAEQVVSITESGSQISTAAAALGSTARAMPEYRMPGWEPEVPLDEGIVSVLEDMRRAYARLGW